MPLGVASPRIRNGDLFLFRRHGPIGWMISAAGRSDYCHCELAGWWNCRIFSLGMTSRGGGRAVCLEQLVAANPGRIDWYKANSGGRWPEYQPQRALYQMQGFLGRRYGWRSIFAAAVRRAPLLRLLVRTSADDLLESRWPPVCSEAIANATRAGGVDPVPWLADCCTEPADLARSSFFGYVGTLYPSDHAEVAAWKP